MIAILRITLAVHSFAASSALTPALSASILLWPSSATWQAPNTVPLASNRSIAMPGQYAARAQGRCGFRIDTGDSDWLLRPGTARGRRGVLCSKETMHSCARNAISQAFRGAAS